MLADKREQEKVDAMKQYRMAMIDQNKAALAEKTRSDQALADYREEELANNRLRSVQQDQQFNRQEDRRSRAQEDANKLARDKLNAQHQADAAKAEARAEEQKNNLAIRKGQLDATNTRNKIEQEKVDKGAGGKDTVAGQRSRGILRELGNQDALDAEIKKTRDDLGKVNTMPTGLSTKDQVLWAQDASRAQLRTTLTQRLRDLELAGGYQPPESKSLNVAPPPTQPSQQGAMPPGASGPGGGGGAQTQREMSDEEQQAALAPFRGMPQDQMPTGPEQPPDLQGMPPNSPTTPPVGSPQHDAMHGQGLLDDFAIAKNPMHPNYSYAWMRLAAKFPGIGRPPRRVMDSASQQMAMQASGLGASVLPLGPLAGPAIMAGTRMLQPAISDWFNSMLPANPGQQPDDSGR
jgi:hypothetical protein